MAHCYDWEPEELLCKYSNMIYKLALSQMKHQQDAEDVFQNVFLRLIKYQPQFKSSEHEKAWLIRATINCCKDTFAKPWYNGTQPLAETIAIEDHYQEDSLLALVQELPEKYKTVIHLFYYEDMSIQEISKVLAKRENTIKSLLHRGRKLLELSLEKRGLLDGLSV